MIPLLNEYKQLLLQEARSPSTVYGVERNLIYFARFLGHEDMRKVTGKIIEKYKIYIMTEYPNGEKKGLSPGSVEVRLGTLSPYFKFLQEKKYIFFDPTMNLEIPKAKKVFPDYIPSEKDIEELLNKPDINEYVGIRDRTIFELMYTCPLRRIEVRRLSIHEVDMKHKIIYPSRAKGGRECGIPIARNTYGVLEKYLEISRPRLAKYSKKSFDNFFLTVYGRPFAMGGINEIIQRYRGNKPIHPHSLRHACAVHMLKHGAGIRDIQVLLGHKDLSSTQQYTKLTANDIKDIQDKYHPRERKYKNDCNVRRV
jgi:integrase/recombinase XerD